MNPVIDQMLQRYSFRSLHEREQALREILQEITLLGLWRAKFFEHAAFYGGTALRIFYGLDRFSEDLDFTLLEPAEDWKWAPYAEAVRSELNAYGFDVSFEEKFKQTESAVKSAFLKTLTVHELLKVGVGKSDVKGIHPESLIRIKIEIDTKPPIRYPCEQKYLSQPVPVSIRCVDEISLFSCKMYAALFRAWKGRVKGRDWYDVIWFIRKKTPLSLSFFSKLSGHDKTLSQEEFLHMVKERIDGLDVKAAIQDIIHFIKDHDVVKESWTRDFFHYWIKHIQFLP